MSASVSENTESHLRAAIAQLIEEDCQLGDHEQRHESRYPFFQPVTITFDNGDQPLSGITRQISPTGVGLLHRAALRAGSVLSITMRDMVGYGVTVPIEIVWCRGCGLHWHVSGARFLAPSKRESLAGDAQGDGLNPERPLFDDIVGAVCDTIAGVVDRPAYGSFYSNRRSEERFYATLPVTATFEDKANSVRTCIRMVTRDLSKNGISLISDQPVTTELLTLEITDRDGQKALSAIMQPLRCRPIGRWYELAGKFISKVYRG
jgi:hypothetical protein